jgi:hypothetical protein
VLPCKKLQGGSAIHYASCGVLKALRLAELHLSK